MTTDDTTPDQCPCDSPVVLAAGAGTADDPLRLVGYVAEVSSVRITHHTPTHPDLAPSRPDRFLGRQNMRGPDIPQFARLPALAGVSDAARAIAGVLESVHASVSALMDRFPTWSLVPAPRGRAVRRAARRTMLLHHRKATRARRARNALVRRNALMGTRINTALGPCDHDGLLLLVTQRIGEKPRVQVAVDPVHPAHGSHRHCARRTAEAKRSRATHRARQRRRRPGR